MQRLFQKEDKQAANTFCAKLGNASIPLVPCDIPNKPGFSFLYFKLNDYPELVNEGAKLIAEHVNNMVHDLNINLNDVCFVTAEASTLALAHVLRTTYNIQGITLYKAKQINDVNPICVEYDTVTAKDPKKLYLGRNRIEPILNKRVIILDSIITTGGTIRGIYEVLEKAGVKRENIVEALMLFTEGEPRNEIKINNEVTLPLVSFSNLPLIEKEPALKAVM